MNFLRVNRHVVPVKGDFIIDVSKSICKEIHSHFLTLLLEVLKVVCLLVNIFFNDFSTVFVGVGLLLWLYVNNSHLGPKSRAIERGRKDWFNMTIAQGFFGGEGD